jgi:DNA invertase Pin-like site-specific DNA recombinase
MSNLLLSVMGAFAEFERNLIKERQAEGIMIAKQKGKYIGKKGRKSILNPEEIELIKSKIASGIPKTLIANEFKITRKTLYNYISS